MKKQRKNKRKKKRTRSKRRLSNSSYEKKWARRVEVDALEIAKGYDGFLRGPPEPVLVCGMFAINDGCSELVGRGIARFPNPRKYPTTLSVSDSTMARATRLLSDDYEVAIVLIAFEEDGGEDIQRAYSMLQAHGELLLLETSDEPIAVEIAGLALGGAHWQVPRRVDLVVDQEHFDVRCHSDKWVSAASYIATKGEPCRVHFVSSDGKNDWTAIVTLR